MTSSKKNTNCDKTLDSLLSDLVCAAKSYGREEHRRDSAQNLWSPYEWESAQKEWDACLKELSDRIQLLRRDIEELIEKQVADDGAKD